MTSAERATWPLDKPCRQFRPDLFDSTAWPDHLRARQICGMCNSVEWCIREAVTIANETPQGWTTRGPDGTWGGLLWRDGRIRVDGSVPEWRHHGRQQEVA